VNDVFEKVASQKYKKVYGKSFTGLHPEGHRFDPCIAHLINHYMSTGYKLSLTFFFGCDSMSFVVNTTKLLLSSGNLPKDLAGMM